METFRIEGKVFERITRIVGVEFSKRMSSEFGTIAVNFSKERFVKKDWHNQVHEKWKARKRKDRGSLMVRTGRLKRSIRKISSGATYVMIGSDVPYAKVHNEGGKTTKSVYVKAHTRKQTIHASTNLRTRKKSRKRVATGNLIKVQSHTRKMNLTVPQRQFMGQSRALQIRLMNHLQKEFTKRVRQNI